MVSNEPENIDVSSTGDVHHLEDTGVTKGINFIDYHVYGTGGKHLMTGTALGQRNLAFRQAEAASGGFKFKTCTGPDCKHESMD